MSRWVLFSLVWFMLISAACTTEVAQPEPTTDLALAVTSTAVPTDTLSPTLPATATATAVPTTTLPPKEATAVPESTESLIDLLDKTVTPAPLPTVAPTAVPIDPAAIQTGAPLLFARDNDLWRADINGQNEQRLTEGQLLADWFAHTASSDPWWWGGFPPQVHISPDGRWLAFNQNGHNLVLVDITGTEETRISPLNGAPTFFTWSPDSRQFVFGSHPLKLYDVATNSITNLLSGYGQGVYDPVWSPDGRFLAFACCFAKPDPRPYEGVLTGEIRQLELASGAVETVGETLNSVGGGTPTICWSLDGTAGIDVALPVACSYEPSFSSAYSPTYTQHAYLSLRSPDDVELFRLLIIAPADEPILQREVPQVQKLFWSPDGQWLLLGNDHYYVEQTAIYRLPADGSGEAEILLPNALLLNVVAAWQ